MNLNLQYNQNQEAADKIAASLSALQEEKLFHIDVYGLAEELSLSRETALNNRLDISLPDLWKCSS